MTNPALPANGSIDMRRLRVEHRPGRDIAAERAEHRQAIENLRQMGSSRPAPPPGPHALLGADGGFRQGDALFGLDATLERYRRRDWRAAPDDDW